MPSVSGWRATMVNDVDVLVEKLGFVCACRTRRDMHDGHDDGHDDAQLLTNQVRQIRASSRRRAVLRLQEERLRLLTPTEQRGCDDPDETWAIPRTLPPQRLTDDAENWLLVVGVQFVRYFVDVST